MQSGSIGRGSVVPWQQTEPVIVGRSAAIERVRDVARRVAASDVKVLITGESGVGKDLFARVIHARSPRAPHPFVAVNCAALTETLLESELFGHVKGSFTGAYRDKIGKLQLADRGTIFLDEVGEMSLRMQALLLRFLENGEIQPVGSDAPPVRSRARVVAATNRDLGSMVAGGQFRKDLMYRLRVVHLEVPPLRERREDIQPFVEHIVATSGRTLRFSEPVMRSLETYHWPGNVRELQNVIEQMAWSAGDGMVLLEHLPPDIARAPEVLKPAVERRRGLADRLHQDLMAGRCNFWAHVYPLFINRDMTRADLRTLVSRGLDETHGSYRALLRLYAIPDTDYKRFLNFLASHDCSVDYRPFRNSLHERADAVVSA